MPRRSIFKIFVKLKNKILGVFGHVEKVGYSISPINGDEYAKKSADYITKRSGGDRAVAEACIHILLKFFEWNDKLGYSLIIKKNNLSLAEVKWQIIPSKNDSCELLIQLDIIKNSLLKNYPNFLRWFIVKVIIKPKMKSYLKSVISGVGFYVETGIAVKKNQFGRNMIFS